MHMAKLVMDTCCLRESTSWEIGVGSVGVESGPSDMSIGVTQRMSGVNASTCLEKAQHIGTHTHTQISVNCDTMQTK